MHKLMCFKTRIDVVFKTRIFMNRQYFYEKGAIFHIEHLAQWQWSTKLTSKEAAASA